MVKFTYNNMTLILPSPKDGDTENIKLRTKVHRAMDGTVWSYLSTPNQSVINLTFGNVNRPKVLEVIDFLKYAAAATNILYTDYDNETWTGAILTQPFESTHVGRSNNTFTLQFECLPVSNGTV